MDSYLHPKPIHIQDAELRHRGNLIFTYRKCYPRIVKCTHSTTENVSKKFVLNEAGMLRIMCNSTYTSKLL